MSKFCFDLEAKPYDVEISNSAVIIVMNIILTGQLRMHLHLMAFLRTAVKNGLHCNEDYSLILNPRTWTLTQSF
jgi:hypothetical protein